MKAITGTCYVAINGEQLEAFGDWKVHMGTPKREELMGHNGVQGYKEEQQAPYFEGSVRKTSNLDLKALFNARDITATLEANDGTSYVLRDAFAASDGEWSTEEGDVPVKFVGVTMDEVK